MEGYVLNGCAQWEFIMCSTGVLNGKVFWMILGILLCAQQDIIGGLNGDVLCAQWKSILDAPWDIIGVLNWKLLECSMGM